ncbi:MAG: type II toxin-antitoxin system HicA family toxin [Bryobacterales bacterium]|nr:type II toxin-antitoxin system HicA family toxin [Bryobacterales bacterium]
MRPVDWKELRDICTIVGCEYDRTRGDHYVMTRQGMARPVVIPMKKDLKEDIVLGIAKTLFEEKAN